MTLRPVLLLLAVLALTACGGGDPEAQAPLADTGETQTGAAPARPSSGPDILGTSLDGEAIGVADFRGKPLFVNVWSSW